MEAFAHFLLETKEFDSFCLSGSDVKTKNCQIFESQWHFNNHQWEYRISANRFLRGMIRLIVGMHLLVGQNKIDLFEIQEDIKSKRLLKGAWSVPPQGLFLTDIIYPYTKQLK
jgi:tRNA pseudouridine38-40 synthase